MSNSQLNKLKSEIKNGTEVSLKPSSNVNGDSNNENNFPHKLLLTNTQVSRLRKYFANISSGNIKLSKTQLHKIGQSGRFLGKLLGPLLKTGLTLMKYVLKPLTKSVLISLESTAASATDTAIHKKMFGSSTITLIISNEEMNDIMKTGLLIKILQNQAKEPKGGFLSMLLGTLGASLLVNLLTGKGTITAGEGIIRAGQ